MKIIRGDALELAQVGCQCDLLVTDPPYAFGGGGAEHEITATVAVALREAALRLNPNRYAVVFSAASWRSIMYMTEALRGVCMPQRIGVWTKPVAKTVVRIAGWKFSSVMVIVFRKGKHPAEIQKGFDCLDHIECAPLTTGRRAQLPDVVCDWAVRPYAYPGGVAVDPFAGSGALLLAAERHGMYGVGYEI